MPTSQTSRSSPKRSRSLSRVGVTVTLRSPPGAPVTVSSIARPCPSCTARSTSSQYFTGRPSTAAILSPVASPTLAAAPVRGDAADDGRQRRPPHEHEHEGEDDGGEDEVHPGTREDDEEAGDEGLAVEGLGRIDRRSRAALERILVVAHHLHVAAHGNGGEAVLGLLRPGSARGQGRSRWRSAPHPRRKAAPPRNVRARG